MTGTQKEQVRASYEAWWSRIQSTLKTHVASGETNLSRLLYKIYADTVGERHAAEKFSILWGQEVPVPYLPANRIVRDWIADTVIAHAADVDAVIETGSGWGYNLFNIWLRGGPDVPYHAFEYTDAGRESAAAVRTAAAAGPQMNIHPFDYYAADLTPATGRYGKVLVYSSHSIEQVGELPSSFIDAVLGLAKDVVCLHFEPVGWQFAAESGQRVGDYGQRAYADKHHYNKNLWRMLKQYEKDGRIVVEQALADTMCVKAYNGTSLLRWRSR